MATLILSDGTRSIDFLSASGFKVPQDGINLPVVSREDTFAEGSDSEGRSRVRSRATNSTAGQISLYLSGATASALWTTIDNLQELVESAHLNKGSISYLGPGASSTVTYDLESISLTDLPQVGIELTQLRCNATITFESKPYGRLPTQRLNVQDSYQTMVTALSPSIFLPLGASSGLTDLSGNARNGTAAGGVTVGGATGPLTVSDGGATDFDGTDDRITTTYNPFANSATRTFMGWAYRDTSSSNDCLLGGSAATNSPNIVLFSGNQNVGFFSDVAGASVSWVAAWPGNGVWVHWALVFNETTNAASLYINGTLTSTVSQTVAYNGTPGNLQIGSYNTTSDAFDGKQAWVSVHQTALTATQIRDAYDTGKAQITLDGPIDSFVVSGVTGQVNAWPDFTLYEASGATVNHVELGVLNEYVAASAPAILLQAVTQITALGGSSNTRASSYSTNILRAALATTPVAVGEATGQNNKGGWKVRARIYPSATTVRVRLAWRVGSGPYAHEPWRTVPGSAAWYDVDLGSVTIPEISVGTHSVTFRLEAMSTSGSPTVDLDVFEILPTDSYLKLRGASSLDTPTSAIVAMDDFSTQTSGAVTGKTPLLAPSGNWSGAGDADDFQVNTTAQNIYRDALSDSALNNGRYLRCGSGTLALTAISCDVSLQASYPDYPSGRYGVFLRYTDTSNWLMAVICDVGTFKLIKRVAGTETVLGTYQDDSTIPFAAGGVIAAAVDATGNVLASVSRSGNSIAGLSVSADSTLATAGALASGGYGIYDATTAAYGDTRTYDNFNVFTGSSSATISNPVILSGGAVEVTNNKAVTRNAGATAWADTPVREGNYPVLPPATRNSSKSLVVVKARRNDVDSAYTDTNLTDKLLLTASVTPRVHLTGT